VTATARPKLTASRSPSSIGGFDRLNELLGLIKEVGGLRKMKELLEAMSAPVDDIKF